MTRIVVLDGKTLGGGDLTWESVAQLGEMTYYDRTDPTDVIPRSKDAEVAVTNKVVFDADTIAQLPNLKMIAVTATGYNVVDVSAARERGIPVANVPIYGTDAVAQHVFAMLLSFIHRPETHHQAVAEGQWSACPDFSFWLNPIFELKNKAMGIVGFGRIGQATARLAQAFGMRVLVHSRTERTVLELESVTWLPLEELFAQSDVVSLHCPQTESNAAFVNSDLISKMRPHAILINTARGTLVHEAELAAALHEGKLGGACLDVVGVEPMEPSNPLRTAPRCIITPHHAWAAREARERLLETTVQNIRNFLGGSPTNVVN